MKCIFDAYFREGKECNNNFDCSSCEIRTEVKDVVQKIVAEENNNEFSSDLIPVNFGR